MTTLQHASRPETPKLGMQTLLHRQRRHSFFPEEYYKSFASTKHRRNQTAAGSEYNQFERTEKDGTDYDDVSFGGGRSLITSPKEMVRAVNHIRMKQR